MLKSLEINGFKSFANQSKLRFDSSISAIVGPNGSGKSNAAEAFRFVLGEQSLKTLRARHSDELLYNGGQDGSRRNRASVKAVFDNSEGLIDIDYNEVVIERIIQRGDASTYRVNGSQVRLKDVVDLLADANIGTSRHHIISQGESDRILGVHERERKSIIEDALGLGRFYRQRKEALQKLRRTQENLAEIEDHRGELLPELRFLKKQKERIEKTKRLREELTVKYQQFFKRETIFLTHKEDEVQSKLHRLSEKVEELAAEIEQTEEEISRTATKEDETNENKEAFREIDEKLAHNEEATSDILKELGRIEGKIQALENQQQAKSDRKVAIPSPKLQNHTNAFETMLAEAEEATETDTKLTILTKMTAAIRRFLDDVSGGEEELDATDESQAVLNQLRKEQSKLKEKQQTLAEERKQLREQRVETQEKRQQTQHEHHEAEKRLLQLSGAKENTEAEMSRLKERKEEYAERRDQLEDERSEAKILCGAEALDIEDIALTDANGERVSKEEFLDYTSRREQREFNRQLERLKIKLENVRVSDQKEVLQEFERVQTRISFLEGEMSDLQESKDSLLVLINEIEETVAEKFSVGIKKINKAFNDFFQTMFGGGSAELFITEHPEGKRERVQNMDETDDDIETEEGVGINVQLPRKKVRGLGVLSGGERSLVSIALLFALSQVKPPPFIVLDEADAALDEANSRRFGDMIQKLSNRSQLIIITHNRETMSQADVLYGVTMDQAGGSRLLSLSFDEAVDAVEV